MKRSNGSSVVPTLKGRLVKVSSVQMTAFGDVKTGSVFWIFRIISTLSEPPLPSNTFTGTISPPAKTSALVGLTTRTPVVL